MSKDYRPLWKKLKLARSLFLKLGGEGTGKVRGNASITTTTRTSGGGGGGV